MLQLMGKKVPDSPLEIQPPKFSKKVHPLENIPLQNSPGSPNIRGLIP